MNEKISRLTAATDQLYWICKYTHLGAVANQDENSGLLAAIEQLADQVNMMAMEVEREEGPCLPKSSELKRSH